jgi:hypothetical protein
MDGALNARQTGLPMHPRHINPFPGFKKAFKTGCQGATVFVFFTPDNGNIGHPGTYYMVQFLVVNFLPERG